MPYPLCMQRSMFPTTIATFQHLQVLELYLPGYQDDNDEYLWVLKLVMLCPRLQKLYLGVYI